MPTAARHSMTTAEWYTPAYIVDAARQAMGSIDLDPASCATANETVRAARYYTAEDDGLMQTWRGNVFLNPPGGKDAHGCSLVPMFWAYLLERFAEETVTQAIWIGYSLEQLQTLQRSYGPTPIDFPICIPKRRIAFVGRGGSPSHANYITYLGDRVAEFEQAFGEIGAVSF